MGFPAMGTANWAPLEAVEAFLALDEDSFHPERKVQRRTQERERERAESAWAADGQKASTSRVTDVQVEDVPEVDAAENPSQKEESAMHLERSKDAMTGSKSKNGRSDQRTTKGPYYFFLKFTYTYQRTILFFWYLHI